MKILWSVSYTHLDVYKRQISNIPDDFLNAVKLQTEYLEDEIDDWLLDENNTLQ